MKRIPWPVFAKAGALVAVSEITVMWLFSRLGVPFPWDALIDVAVIFAVSAWALNRWVLVVDRKESLHLIEELLGSVTDGVTLQDEKGQILRANQAASRILGLTHDQLLGRQAWDPSWKAVNESGVPLKADQIPMMVTLKTKIDQTGVLMGVDVPLQGRRWIRVSTRQMLLESKPHVIAVFSDLTDFVESKMRLEMAIEAMHFGIWDWNLKSNKLNWDRRMYDLYEISPNDFVGDFDAFSKSVLPDDLIQLNQELQTCFSEQRPLFSSRFRIRTRDGTLKFIGARARCLYDGDGKIERAIGVNWDLTVEMEKERLKNVEQAQLFHSSKMSTLGEMASGIAHEINNPLAIIKGRADHLMAAAQTGKLSQDPELWRSGLRQISKTADRIAQIVRGLKALSRNADGDAISEFSMQEVLAETLALCEERFRSKGVELVKLGSLDPIRLVGRPTQLSQVLLNLLNNAFYIQDKSGDSRIELSWQAGPGALFEIRVRDWGPGISPENRSKVMQPFFTTKGPGEGTGLGLSISKSLMENMGGRLEIESFANPTTFVVRVPKG